MTIEDFNKLEYYDHLFDKDGKCWWVCDIVPSGITLQAYDDYKELIIITKKDDLSGYVVIR